MLVKNKAPSSISSTIHKTFFPLTIDRPFCRSQIADWIPSPSSLCGHGEMFYLSVLQCSHIPKRGNGGLVWKYQTEPSRAHSEFYGFLFCVGECRCCCPSSCVDTALSWAVSTLCLHRSLAASPSQYFSGYILHGRSQNLVSSF